MAITLGKLDLRKARCIGKFLFFIKIIHELHTWTIIYKTKSSNLQYIILIHFNSLLIAIHIKRIKLSLTYLFIRFAKRKHFLSVTKFNAVNIDDLVMQRNSYKNATVTNIMVEIHK